MGWPKITDDCYWCEHGKTATHTDVADQNSDIALLPHADAQRVIERHNAVIEKIAQRYIEFRDERDKRIVDLEAALQPFVDSWERYGDANLADAEAYARASRVLKTAW